MKTGTLVCSTVFLGLFVVLQEVNGGKNVDDKKLNSWSKKTRTDDKAKTEKYEFKNDSKLVKEGDKVEDLIEVIQYVITNVFNNQEFRTFMIKRFLHNYVLQASEYLKEIKELKMEMDPKAAAQDDKINKAMNV